MQVAWQLDKEGLITDNGEIVWAEIIKPYKTEITAELSCEDVQESVVLELTIQPPQRTKFEQWLQNGRLHLISGLRILQAIKESFFRQGWRDERLLIVIKQILIWCHAWWG